MLVFTSKALFSFEGSVLFQLRPRNARAMEAARFSTASVSPFATGAHRVSGTEASVSLEEWQGWGSTSPVPAMVLEVIEDLKLLEKNIDAHMDFGGNHGKLVGDFKVYEDKKHREKFKSLGDSEKKLQFFSARQIACRVLGSRDYLCQKCWLPKEDCMCSRVMPYHPWHHIRFWLYMHPKDFLRQNNTGKLLWQVFGVQAATLCLFGISEHEEMLWNALKLAGKDKVWCLYPNKNATPNSVKDIFYQNSLEDQDCQPKTGILDVGGVVTRQQGLRLNVLLIGDRGVDLTPSSCGGTGHSPNHYRPRQFELPYSKANYDDVLNFILLDGTWSNSNAMFNRLKERAMSIWGEELPCISLNTGVSMMRRLRPQPSWDRTCTAAAAIGLLYELHLLPAFNSYGLDKQADAIEDALEVLLEALTTRRLRMGRSITRKERHNSNIMTQL